MLPDKIIAYIRNTDKSYSQLIRDININFGEAIGKSTISYYKSTTPRIKPIDTSNISHWELEWLFGLYYADGSKFVSNKYVYTIKIDLDRIRDSDIAERVIDIVKRLGANPIVSTYKNVLTIKLYSKLLYNIFPSKSENYRPRNILAFLAGMIDGDGCVPKQGMWAIIAQDHLEGIMSYLVGKLNLSKYEQKNKSDGTVVKINYYVPVELCKVLLGKRYCIKITRKLNETERACSSAW